MIRKDREGNICIVQSFKYRYDIDQMEGSIYGDEYYFYMSMRYFPFDINIKYKNLIFEIMEKFAKDHVIKHINKSIVD